MTDKDMANARLFARMNIEGLISKAVDEIDRLRGELLIEEQRTAAAEELYRQRDTGCDQVRAELRIHDLLLNNQSLEYQKQQATAKLEMAEHDALMLGARIVQLETDKAACLCCIDRLEKQLAEAQSHDKLSKEAFDLAIAERDEARSVAAASQQAIDDLNDKLHAATTPNYWNQIAPTRLVLRSPGLWDAYEDAADAHAAIAKSGKNCVVFDVRRFSNHPATHPACQRPAELVIDTSNGHGPLFAWEDDGGATDGE